MRRFLLQRKIASSLRFPESPRRLQQIANLKTNLYLIPGVLLGSVACFYSYKAKLLPEWAILIGFFLFTTYHLIIYLSFGKQFEFTAYFFPSLLRGAAFSFLYISIALYTSKYADPGIVLKVAGSMIIFRSFIGSGLCNGIYGYLLYTQRIRHLDHLAGQVQLGSQGSRDLKTASALYSELQNQAALSSCKEITGIILIYGLLMLILLSLYFISRPPVSKVSE